jgi:hypothetical protein
MGGSRCHFYEARADSGCKSFELYALVTRLGKSQGANASYSICIRWHATRSFTHEQI